MASKNIQPLIEDLGANIDELEEALEPLLQHNISDVAAKLPLMDKAKLNVLSAYTIESLVFSALTLNGVDAKQHAVFSELSRVKEYFQKIKEAEEGPQQRKMAVDTAAAGRFIKHGLSGNDNYAEFNRAQVKKEKQNTSRGRTGEHAGVGGKAQGTTRRKRKRSRQSSVTSNADTTTAKSSKIPTNGTPSASQTKDKDEQQGRSMNRKERRHAQKKLNKVPRSGKQVFKDLANRPTQESGQGSSSKG